MSHPDEGTIQMLLDGELDSRERERVEDHIAGCASCAAHLAEAREFLQEADRLVDVLAVPQRESKPRVAVHRRPLVRTLAWAASIAVAVGIGYWGRGANPAVPATPVLQERDAV
jgi:anti-sigma factor RsiW